MQELVRFGRGRAKMWIIFSKGSWVMILSRIERKWVKGVDRFGNPCEFYGFFSLESLQTNFQYLCMNWAHLNFSFCTNNFGHREFLVCCDIAAVLLITTSWIIMVYPCIEIGPNSKHRFSERLLHDLLNPFSRFFDFFTIFFWFIHNFSIFFSFFYIFSRYFPIFTQLYEIFSRVNMDILISFTYLITLN